jgi:hypothetical protein
MECPNCGSQNVHEHDSYCDDEHDEGNCFSFYCDDCGEGFDE